jgi:hypothetical protein
MAVINTHTHPYLGMVADVLHSIRAQCVIQGDTDKRVGMQGRVDQNPLCR